MDFKTKSLKKNIALPVFIFSFLSFSLFINTVSAQPNFVIVLADDQGWTGSSKQMDANIAGSKSDYYYTPELELLAQQGMTFSQGYAPAPKCSPSRCAILTGRSTARNQFTNTDNAIATGKILIEPNSNTSLNGVDTTLAEWLKSIGMNYRTAHYGKWHQGAAAASSPGSNGFDFNDGSTNNNTGNQGGTVQADPKKIFDLTNRSITFIQDAVTDGVPFFLTLSHYAVHADVEARQATIDLYNDPIQRPPGIIHSGAEYAAMTEDMDTGIGQLLAEITNQGIDGNTYVIFLSDNGGQANFTNNTPLFRGKTFIYEGGIRVPFIIKGPNIAANTYNTEPIVGYDLFPTIAALTGSSATLPANLDGQNLVPLLTGNSFTRTAPLYFHSPHYDNNPNKTPRSAIVDSNYKLVVEYETGNTSLYDLSTDIGEGTDLSGAQAVLAHTMCVQLRDHLKSVNASMPTLDPSHANFSGTAPDIDADGLDDEWEFREMLSFTYGPSDDPDGDNFTNLEEFNNGTDPYFHDPALALSEHAFFQASIASSNKIELAWAAMENGEVDFIEIERSFNATDWETIGKVSKGASKFMDVHPLNGLAYYRLKVVNVEGVTDYSTIISIVLNVADFVKIYPNPVGEKLYLEFENPEILPTVFELKVFNEQGQMLRQFEKNKASQIALSLGNLTPGIYFIQIDLGASSTKNLSIPFVVE